MKSPTESRNGHKIHPHPAGEGHATPRSHPTFTCPHVPCTSSQVPMASSDVLNAGSRCGDVSCSSSLLRHLTAFFISVRARPPPASVNTIVLALFPGSSLDCGAATCSGHARAMLVLRSFGLCSELLSMHSAALHAPPLSNFRANLPVHASAFFPRPALISNMPATTSCDTSSGPTSEKATPPMDEVTPNDESRIELGNLAAYILPHILNLYNCNATAVDYEIYDPKATFEDPVMQAQGVKQIESAFYSIPKDAKTVEYTVTEEESAPRSGEIKIDNLQRYKLRSKTIDVVSLISLQVENGKVMHHIDMWNKKPLLDRNTIKVTLVGRVMEKLRRGNMLVTHLFMGSGMDPTPHS